MLLIEFGPGEAPCAGSRLFFEEHDRELTHAAKAICMSCPAQVDCLYQAAARRERDGVWGGVSFWGPIAGGLRLPSEWARLLGAHQAADDAGGLHAVAIAVVSSLRSRRGRRAG